jgi:hypothetical protein
MATALKLVGQTTFVKVYGGSSFGYSANSIQQTTDGGYITCGTRTPGSGYSFVALMKTDATGDTIWTRFYRLGVVSTGKSVQQTNDGGYIITGMTCPNTGWLPYPFLIKTDSNGDTLWTKRYSVCAYGESVRQTPDGGYILTGETTNAYAGPVNDLFLLRLDASGNIRWTKTFGGANTEVAYALRVTSDNGFIITGSTRSFGAGDLDIYLVKTDSLGTLLWSRTYGMALYEEGIDVKQTTDGGYIVTGNTKLDSLHEGIFLIKTDMNGDTLWTKIYGGSISRDIAMGKAVEQTSDGGYIVAGDYYDHTSINGYDMILLKTTSNGTLSWQTFIGAWLNEWCKDLIQTTDGGYMVAGFSTSFGNPNGEFFVAKTNQSGSSGCFSFASSVHDTIPTWIVTSPPTSTSTLLSTDSANAFYLERGFAVSSYCFTNAIEENTDETAEMNIFPNPSNDHFTVEIAIVNSGKVNVSIANVLGEIVYSENDLIQGEKFSKEIQTQKLQGGIYFVRITDGETIYNKQIVICH